MSETSLNKRKKSETKSTRTFCPPPGGADVLPLLTFHLADRSFFLSFRPSISPSSFYSEAEHSFEELLIRLSTTSERVGAMNALHCLYSNRIPHKVLEHSKRAEAIW